MKTAEVYILISVFLTLFAVLVVAYGIGLWLNQIQVALVLGFGVAIFLAALYFYLKGKHMAENEKLDELKE